MPLEAFTREAARVQRGVDAMSLSKVPKIQTIQLDLMQAPQKRNPEIIKTHLEAGYKVSLKEFGNEALAQAYWNQIAGLMKLSFKELSRIPRHQRGPLWYDAAATMIDICQEQAFLQSGMAQDAMVQGAELGAKQKKLIGNASKEQIKKASFAINAEMKKQEAEENGNGEK